MSRGSEKTERLAIRCHFSVASQSYPNDMLKYFSRDKYPNFRVTFTCGVSPKFMRFKLFDSLKKEEISSLQLLKHLKKRRFLVFGTSVTIGQIKIFRSSRRTQIKITRIEDTIAIRLNEIKIDLLDANPYEKRPQIRSTRANQTIPSKI